MSEMLLIISIVWALSLIGIGRVIDNQRAIKGKLDKIRELLEKKDKGTFTYKEEA